MKSIKTFACKSLTDAKDKANIYYISAPAAIIIEHKGNTFEVRTKTKTIAVFRY